MFEWFQSLFPALNSGGNILLMIGVGIGTMLFVYGAFDAVRTWEPIPWGGVTSFNPLNVGNPDLGPERTVEIEAGFDGSFFDEHLRATFTYYDQETRDALIPVPLVPSLGFGGSQLRNVGTLANKGVDVLLDALPVNGKVHIRKRKDKEGGAK